MKAIHKGEIGESGAVSRMEWADFLQMLHNITFYCTNIRMFMRTLQCIADIVDIVMIEDGGNNTFRLSKYQKDAMMPHILHALTMTDSLDVAREMICKANHVLTVKKRPMTQEDFAPFIEVQKTAI